jgi:hypothetical protein
MIITRMWKFIFGEYGILQFPQKWAYLTQPLIYVDNVHYIQLPAELWRESPMVAEISVHLYNMYTV